MSCFAHENYYHSRFAPALARGGGGVEGGKRNPHHARFQAGEALEFAGEPECVPRMFGFQRVHLEAGCFASVLDLPATHYTWEVHADAGSVPQGRRLLS